MSEPPGPSRPTLSPGRRRLFIAIILVCCAGVLAAVLPHLVRSRRHHGFTAGPETRRRRPVAPGADNREMTHPVFDDAAFVWDDETFVRPRAHHSVVADSRSIDGLTKLSFSIRHVEHGIIRHEPLGLLTGEAGEPVRPAAAPLGEPTVLLLGDSHLYATAPMDRHVYYLLEQGLRARQGREQAIVINGACPYFSLYQYVLRARALWDFVQPDLLVVVLFVGNDLLELEDVGRPHIDDSLTERELASEAPTETTTARRLLFERTAPREYKRMFWQGINQEIYFLQHPERYEPVMRKAAYALELLRAECERNGTGLVVALLPPYEDIHDYRLPFDLDSSISALTGQKTNRRLREDLLRVLETLGIVSVDLFQPLQQAGEEALYDADFHIWIAGHKVMVEALLPALQSQL